MRKFIFIIACVAFFSCTDSGSSGASSEKDNTKKDSSAAKDTSNPNAPGATNAQY